MSKKKDKAPDRKLIDLWKKGMGGGDKAVDDLIRTMVGQMQKGLSEQPDFAASAAYCIYLAWVMSERADVHWTDALDKALAHYCKEKNRLLKWEKKHDQVVAFNKAKQEGATTH